MENEQKIADSLETLTSLAIITFSFLTAVVITGAITYLGLWDYNMAAHIPDISEFVRLK